MQLQNNFQSAQSAEVRAEKDYQGFDQGNAAYTENDESKRREEKCNATQKKMKDLADSRKQSTEMISLALQDAIAIPNIGAGHLRSNRKARSFYTWIARKIRHAKQDESQRSPEDTFSTERKSVKVTQNFSQGSTMQVLYLIAYAQT